MHSLEKDKSGIAMYLVLISMFPAPVLYGWLVLGILVSLGNDLHRIQDNSNNVIALSAKLFPDLPFHPNESEGDQLRQLASRAKLTVI